MRIIVNHLTRMQPGYICVAGVDVSSGKHIRPVVGGRVTRDLLACYGGPFDVATLVDLGPVEPVGHAPEVEDHSFIRSNVRKVNDVAPNNFWNFLKSVAQKQLKDIFGPELQQNGRTCALPLGTGLASLGCLKPVGRCHMYRDGFDSLRLQFTDGDLHVSPAVTDIRLYEDDQITPKIPVIVDIQRRISEGVDIILSVGITRAWQKPNDTQERHWLQVNGIHLADDPVWQLGAQNPGSVYDFDAPI